ncbi:MAG: hypothetical protein P8M61_07550 [Crocinitomicaceae bacterium]|jgi:hypothetical protein|nr:hypothetical protein [Crocinitomicaceae bacterium]MDG1347899.1 hypothetical protein [Crocinitomicaceae bacterium]MDG2464928.1 hypothetical protein [Crocinitomicaceae bacterium]
MTELTTQEKDSIREDIAKMKTTLTGDLFQDMDIQQKIYELKVQLNPKIVENPQLDDEECLSCGS